MTLAVLYSIEDKMSKDSVIKVVDNEYHIKYYGRFIEVPRIYLHMPIDGYRYEWYEYTIWLE